jgi:hypothetical protein
MTSTTGNSQIYEEFANYFMFQLILSSQILIQMLSAELGGGGGEAVQAQASQK